MKAVIQRVDNANVSIENKTIASISRGAVIFIGINYKDTEDDMMKLSNKILKLRVFNDSFNKTNLSIQDIKGEILLISQFTLCANTKKGNRPSFQKAMEQIVTEDDPEKQSNMINSDFFIRSCSGVSHFRESVAQCFECMRVCPINRPERKLK